MSNPIPPLVLTTVRPDGLVRTKTPAIRMEEGLALYGYDWLRSTSIPTPAQLDDAHGHRWDKCPLFQAVYYPSFKVRL